MRSPLCYSPLSRPKSRDGWFRAPKPAGNLRSSSQDQPLGKPRPGHKDPNLAVSKAARWTWSAQPRRRTKDGWSCNPDLAQAQTTDGMFMYKSVPWSWGSPRFNRSAARLRKLPLCPGAKRGPTSATEPCKLTSASRLLATSWRFVLPPVLAIFAMMAGTILSTDGSKSSNWAAAHRQLDRSRGLILDVCLGIKEAKDLINLRASGPASRNLANPHKTLADPCSSNSLRSTMRWTRECSLASTKSLAWENDRFRWNRASLWYAADAWKWLK